MGLKLLVFPSILILSLVLVIGFIQPQVMSILEQRETKKVKEEALSKVESVESNIRSLSQTLLSRRESERLIYRYYPEKTDQERAVDMINFLAQQSGVTITSFEITQAVENRKKVVPVETQSEDGTIIDPAASGEVTATPPSHYGVTVRAIGPYSSLRGFFERLYRTDRLRTVKSFGLNEIKRVSQEEKDAIPPEFLEGIAKFEFLYVDRKKSGNALNQPLFQSGTLDLSGVNQLVDFISSPVSDLVSPPKGRVNPFQALP